MDENACIEKVLLGDPAAFSYLVGKYQSRLVAFLWNLLGCGENARDAASDFNDRDGHFIHIDNGNGYASAYHHLDSRNVKKGDTVTQGQLIGTVGSSGVSTGPHLHFEIRCNGEPRNPFDFIGSSKKN